MLKKGELRFSTVNHFESGGTCDKKVFEFGTTGKWGIAFLLIAVKSWAYNHPCPLVLQTGKICVLQGLVQGMISPGVIGSSIIGVRPCMALGFNGY